MTIVYNIRNISDLVIPLMCPICKTKWENEISAIQQTLPAIMGQSVNFNDNVDVSAGELRCRICSFNAVYEDCREKDIQSGRPGHYKEEIERRPIPLLRGDHGRHSIFKRDKRK